MALAIAGYVAFPDRSLAATTPIPIFVFALLVLTYSLAAAILFAFAHRDARPFYLGGTLLLVACAFSNPLLTTSLQPVTYIQPQFLTPYLFWAFAMRFPTARPFERFYKAATVCSRICLVGGFLLAGAVLCADFLVLIRGPSFLTSAREFEMGIQNIGWAVLLAFELPALAFIFHRTQMAPLPERRRVRLFTAGLLVGSLPIALAVAAEVLIPSYRAFVQVNRLAVGLFIYSSIAFVPLITAYSVLVHRILDVRLIVRKAMQYALARYTLAALTALPLIGFAVFVYQRRTQPINELLKGGEALVFVGTAIAGLVTVSARRRLIDVLDRRFFREQYDARVILAGLVERIRSASSLVELDQILRTQIDKALRPEVVDTFTLQSSSRSYSPMHTDLPLLSINSDLSVLIASNTGTLDTDLEDPDLPIQVVASEDRQWLVTGGIQLIVPIRGAAEMIHGFIALGRRRNELPYTSEDRLLLSTIASSAALALDAGLADSTKSQERRKADEQALICITCNIVFPETQGSCTKCGGSVEPANVPYVLLDKFRLEKKVGAGGMGVVYRASDLTLKRTVAIKTLPTISPEHAIQLRREARAMASVTHPNLAMIFGAETWHAQPVLIVEYMTGGTLSDRLLRGPMPPNQVIRIGVQLAGVLDHLHAVDILHRDIKPSNIGFTTPDVPKLLDFGLAQLLHDRQTMKIGRDWQNVSTTVAVSTEKTVTDYKEVLAGTPAYMSPEIVKGQGPDPSCDLWALAMVLYESLSLHNPLRRSNLGETLKAVAAAHVPDVRGKVPSCPPPLAEFLIAALSSDVRKRPRSAKDFQKHLETIQDAV